jgi:hypothetical protein
MDQLRGEAGETLVIALGSPVLDPNIFRFDVPVISKA